jgi:uncharacterized protein
MKGGKKMKTKNNAIALTGIISAAIVLIALGFLILASPVSGNEALNVQGIATVEAMPDLVSVYFNAETNAESAQEAKDLNSEITNEVISNLLDLGIARENITTENFNVYQDYDWTEKGRVEKGFKATHRVKFQLSSEEMDLIGDVVDAGVDAGALISSINFELTRESQNKYKAEAMKLAAEDAKVKAGAVAEGFGKKVGKLVSVQVSDFNYYPWNVYSAEGYGVAEDAVMAKEVAMNIQPGEREISATVNAAFKLK